MRITNGQTVLITGASGGLGTYIAREFASRGVNLALVAFPGVELENLRRLIEKNGVRAVSIHADLRDPRQREEMLQKVYSEFGRIDLLVNNAGIEFTSAYHDLTQDNIHDVLAVNLEAPMALTRAVIPKMLEARAGHIVNISSLAGRATPAFQEPYVASKAGLIAFTYSLRATYRNSGVSASVIVPGFVEAGIYENLKTKSGCSAPWVLGTSKPEKVARLVARSVERNLPEVVINPLPVRPLLAFNILFPRAGEWATNLLGGNEFFREVAGRIRAKESGQKPEGR